MSTLNLNKWQWQCQLSGWKCHLADGAFAEVGFQNAYPALLVRQGDVDELIQTAGSQDGRVDDVWPVCGSDNKDVLLTGHSVHLGQDLVDDAVGCSAAISHVATTGFSYGVELIEEENTGSCLTSLEARKSKINHLKPAGRILPTTARVPVWLQRSCLVKDLSDVGLRLSKPHGEQLWAFDGDEVCLALVGNGFGQQSLPTTRWSIEQHALGWCHSKLEELVWVLHWVLNFNEEIYEKIETTTNV